VHCKPDLSNPWTQPLQERYQLAGQQFHRDHQLKIRSGKIRSIVVIIGITTIIIIPLCTLHTFFRRRKTPVKNKKQVDARETLKRARVEYDDDNACTSHLSKLIRDCESTPSVTSYSQFKALDESVISFVDVLRKVNPVTVVEDV